MSKGKASSIGDRNVAANGYTYEKTSTGWRLLHHLVAERTLKREITKADRVSFKNNDRTDFRPENIIVTVKADISTSGYYRRLHSIEERMVDLVDDAPDTKTALDDLLEALNNVRSIHGLSIIQ